MKKVIPNINQRMVYKAGYVRPQSSNLTMITPKQALSMSRSKSAKKTKMMHMARSGLKSLQLD